MAGPVIDASVALAWMLPGEELAQHARAVADRVAADGALAPSIWRLEVANGLLSAARKGRIEPAAIAELTSRLVRLPIVIDAETAARAWDSTVTLALEHRLTAYDAAYLELALRTGRPLATYDRDLLGAAEAEGLERL
ncbi:MAG: type II toxin-antitoxin system VapC family toxin [Caulobacteraceae bacterium]